MANNKDEFKKLLAELNAGETKLSSKDKAKFQKEDTEDLLEMAVFLHTNKDIMQAMEGEVDPREVEDTFEYVQKKILASSLYKKEETLKVSFWDSIQRIFQFPFPIPALAGGFALILLLAVGYYQLSYKNEMHPTISFWDKETIEQVMIQIPSAKSSKSFQESEFSKEINYLRFGVLSETILHADPNQSSEQIQEVYDLYEILLRKLGKQEVAETFVNLVQDFKSEKIAKEEFTKNLQELIQNVETSIPSKLAFIGKTLIQWEVTILTQKPSEEIKQEIKKANRYLSELTESEKKNIPYEDLVNLYKDSESYFGKEKLSFIQLIIKRIFQ